MSASYLLLFFFVRGRHQREDMFELSQKSEKSGLNFSVSRGVCSLAACVMCLNTAPSHLHAILTSSRQRHLHDQKDEEMIMYGTCFSLRDLLQPCLLVFICSQT